MIVRTFDDFSRVESLTFGAAPDGHDWDNTPGSPLTDWGVDGDRLFVQTDTTIVEEYAAAVVSTDPLLWPWNPWAEPDFTVGLAMMYDTALEPGDVVEWHIKILGESLDFPQVTLFLDPADPRVTIGLEGLDGHTDPTATLPVDIPHATPFYVKWHRHCLSDTNEVKVWWDPNPEPSAWQLTGAVGSTDTGSNSFIWRPDFFTLTNATRFSMDWVQFSTELSLDGGGGAALRGHGRVHG